MLAGGSGVRLAGRGLHAGETTAVTLSGHDGPLTFAQQGRRAALHELTPERTDHGVTLAGGKGLRIDMVEHLLGAFAGLAVRRGILATVEGSEIPLLDGGARAFARAITGAALAGEAPDPPTLQVSRSAELRVGSSVYRFSPGARVELDVEVFFDHPAVGREHAHWRGDRDDFLANIAPARTFGFARDAARLWAAGRARGVDLDAVIVFTETGVLPGCRPPDRGEIARHKLLDLLGDLACYGGPPMGTIEAVRPGHGATHEAARRALREGIVSQRCR